MALGGILGGVILAGLGTSAIPIAAALFVVLSHVIIATARRHAFPSPKPHAAPAVPRDVDQSI